MESNLSERYGSVFGLQIIVDRFENTTQVCLLLDDKNNSWKGENLGNMTENFHQAAYSVFCH